jgi:hypothetical protein
LVLVWGSQCAFRIFLEHASEEKFIVGKCRYILEAIHTETVLRDGPAQSFRKWLQQEENSVGSGLVDIARLHREFLASHLQRSFMARALGLDPRITCMGSAATAAYCNTIGECRWKPRIWICSLSDQVFTRKYRRCTKGRSANPSD